MARRLILHILCTYSLQDPFTFVLKNSDSSLMLSLLLSSKSISGSAGRSPFADCDLDSSRVTEADLFPWCIGTSGEEDRPSLVCALGPPIAEGLQDTMFLRDASFMLFARVDTIETSWATSIEVFEADLRDVGRGAVERTDDCMPGSSRPKGGVL